MTDRDEREQTAVNDSGTGVASDTALTQRRSRPVHEWTYFIRDAEGIKIGRSVSPQSRMHDLQGGNGSTWKSIAERPEWDHQPGRQFIHLQGYCDHSGAKWHRAICGTAFIRKPGADDEMLQYRAVDIIQLCKDGDIDPHSAEVTHWMPAIFPAIDEPTRSPQVTEDTRHE